jgi:hypothetical protein
MIFRSCIVGSHWDNWCYFYEGKYFLYYLITEKGVGEGFGVAISEDGVHWEDLGWAIRASDECEIDSNTWENAMVFYLGTGYVWKLSDFEETGRFICNYSEMRRDESGKLTQNILFAWSTDLIHWNKYGDEYMFKVDERFYEKYGRWDTISTIPRKDGGYYGTWTATPKGSTELNRGIGFGYSEDGLRWKAFKPEQVVPEADESGGFIKFGEKIYAMFGKSGEMVAYSADNIYGPYRKANKNSVLLHGGHSYYSRFFMVSNEVLVNHQSFSGKGHIKSKDPFTYVAPFKKAVVDKEGVLRLKYWRGNEALKGKPCNTVLRTDNALMFYVTDKLDFAKGFVAEGNIIFPDKEENEAVVLYLDVENKKYFIKIFSEGVVEFYTVLSSMNKEEEKISYHVNREFSLPKKAHFRLLSRLGLLEFYLKDHLIECWTMRCPDAKNVRLGMIHSPKKNSISDLKVWEMSL